MNLTLRFAALAALSLASLSAFATVYTDSIGDIAVSGAPYPHIDITSVEVTNTATDLTFAISLNGSPIATNWGKYNVIMKSPSVAASDPTGNGWGRPYGMSGGANRFIGGWADQASNNAQLWSYGGSAWSQDATFSSTITASSISYTVSLASLGLAPGDVLHFDVVTTGGGGTDSAVDALSNSSPQITDWGQTTSVKGVNYTVTPVPEPASIVALGLGAVAFLRRRRR